MPRDRIALGQQIGKLRLLPCRAFVEWAVSLAEDKIDGRQVFATTCYALILWLLIQLRCSRSGIDENQH